MVLGAQWRAVQREAQLAAEQAAQGITALGRANYAQTGLYSQAFFGLTVGLERMGKLVFLADHAIRNSGAFPTDAALRGFHHNLSSLLAKCDDIAGSLDETCRYSTRPSSSIHVGIVEVLSTFGTTTRYYNLNLLAGASQNQQDPIFAWWEKVGVPICERHYSVRQRTRDAMNASIIARAIGNATIARHSTEDGRRISDIRELSALTGATSVVQKYGRLYTLQIVRWLAAIIGVLSHRAVSRGGCEALHGADEPFAMFMNEDSYLRDRRTWSIYRT